MYNIICCKPQNTSVRCICTSLQRLPVCTEHTQRCLVRWLNVGPVSGMLEGVECSEAWPDCSVVQRSVTGFICKSLSCYYLLLKLCSAAEYMACHYLVGVRYNGGKKLKLKKYSRQVNNYALCAVMVVVFYALISLGQVQCLTGSNSVTKWFMWLTICDVVDRPLSLHCNAGDLSSLPICDICSRSVHTLPLQLI